MLGFKIRIIAYWSRIQTDILNILLGDTMKPPYNEVPGIKQVNKQQKQKQKQSKSILLGPKKMVFWYQISSYEVSNVYLPCQFTEIY